MRYGGAIALTCPNHSHTGRNRHRSWSAICTRRYLWIMARFDSAVARRVGALAAYAGGAVTAAGALGVGVLFGQALIARLTIPGAEAPPPRCAGEYGSAYSGEPIRLAVLGDSSAAGYGGRTASETPGALLATWISDALQRPVRLCCPAFVGAISAWLAPQVETAIEEGVDL